MPVAYSYIRFSTAEQKKGDSLRRQAELSEAYAAQYGLTLDTSLHLRDLGLSAFDRSNVVRGALGGFLEAINRGRIAAGSYLLVESLDRLSRAQVLDALKVFISILEKGITIVTLADGMVYNTESVGSNFGSLMFSITIMARAHEESATKSRRLKAAWTSKRKDIGTKKLTGQCPRWMGLNADKTEFELVPDRVVLVREILSLARDGVGQAQIAKRLNERGVQPFSRHGTGWHGSYVHKIITSTALYGEMQPHALVDGKLVPQGDPVPNYYPALITKDEFHFLQSARSQRLVGGAKARKGTDVPNILSGVAKCGYCGSSMILAGASVRKHEASETTSQKKVANKVLVCDGGRRGLGCYAVQWSYKDFEKSFLTFCRSLDLRQLLGSVDINAEERIVQLTVSDQLHSVQSSIAECRKRMDRLMEALELGDVPATVLGRIRELETEIAAASEREKALKAQLQVVESSSRYRSVEMETVRELVGQIESLTGDQLFRVRAALAEHIRRLIEVVKVYPAGPLETPERIEQLRAELIGSGFSAERADAYIVDNFRTEPKRQGRGVRGRYASRRDMGRHFLVKAKNGGFRVVYPDFDDPSQVTVEMGGSGG